MQVCLQAQVVLAEGVRHLDTLRYYIVEGMTEDLGGMESSMPIAAVVALRKSVVASRNFA